MKGVVSTDSLAPLFPRCTIWSSRPPVDGWSADAAFELVISVRARHSASVHIAHENMMQLLMHRPSVTHNSSRSVVLK